MWVWYSNIDSNVVFLGDCEGRGYRSNGVYETGLPGGMCGYGILI